MKNNKSSQSISSLIHFLEQSPTPFHAILEMSRSLEEAGFEKLDEGKIWTAQAGGKYFVTRNGSSLIAFKMGKKYPEESGWKMLGTHTDSPCLKLKAQGIKKFRNYTQAGVEVYGGAILHTWFDRDLSLAGRISCLSEKGKTESHLLNFKRPIAIIPSLAIHLHRNVNENFSVNAQKDLPAILLQSEKKLSLEEILLDELKEQKLAKNIKKILAHELSFYDTQSPSLVGWEEQFLASARLDNLLSCWIGLQALLESKGSSPCLLVCNDHEEVGSVSASGAEGPFLKSILQRINPHSEDFARAMHQSLFISCDNAHGIHPNYPEKHDEQHAPLLNAGPVIKINSNQRYASNSESSAEFVSLCEEEKIPYQHFMVRSDMACGSTIGPLTAANLGVKTVDIGIPTFGMHSIRETAGVEDIASLQKILTTYFSS